MPVVAGIDAFKDAMAAHANEYVLIGGGACSLLFEESGLSFRPTNDLDIVILVDECNASFARDFWAFVKEGGYQAGMRKEGGCRYYRFLLPKESPLMGTYPTEIELFARHPDFELEDEESHIAPLPFDETASSLSAIILDDGYYEFIKKHVAEVDDVPVMPALHIIPLKMRAHIDNNRLHREGVRIREKNLTKHRSDVYELTALIPNDSRLQLEGILKTDALKFLEDFRAYAERNTNRKQRAKLLDALELMQRVYL